MTKKIKKKGDRDKEGQHVEEKKKKKEKRMDEMKVGKRGNNIMNKKSNWEVLPQYFHNEF